MKKIGYVALVVLAVLAVASPALAAMDSKDYTMTVSGTGTSSVSLVCRGELVAVRVHALHGTTGPTGTVTVASEEATLFSRTVTAAGTYYPTTRLQDALGNAIGSASPLWTNTAVQADGIVIGTNYTVGVSPVGRFPMAGTVTTTIAGGNTNVGTWTIRLIYDR